MVVYDRAKNRATPPLIVATGKSGTRLSEDGGGQKDKRI